MNKLSILFFALSLAFIARAQNTCFQKVYTFEDTLGIISNVFVNQDSTYIIGASTGRFNRTSASIIILDKEGNVLENNVYKDTLRDETLGFGKSKVYKDVNDNFWFLYTSKHEQNWKSFPKVLKFEEGSSTIQTSEIDTLAKQYFQCVDGSKLIVDEANDRYYSVFNYNYFNDLDTNSTLPFDVGCFVLCYQISNDSLLYMKKHNFSTTATGKPRRIMYNYLAYSNGNHLLIQGENYNNSSFSSQYCKIFFRTIDPTDGSVISTKQLQDTPWSNPGYGAAFINNEKDLLISYTESDTLYTTTTIPQPYNAVRPTIARLDSNFNVVWKDTLRTFLSSTLACLDCIEKFVLNDADSSFVGAHGYVNVKNYNEPNELIYRAMRITKRWQTDGSVIWNRDFNYYPVVNYNYYANYDVYDAENTLDGGYIFVGESTNFDSLNANAPGQLGYVLKTNCLGFLDDPQAGFSAEDNDSLGINFLNTSLMGGSFQWVFGDGTMLTTGENADSIFHIYSDTGSYEVQLIAFGCNGVNDTISQTVVVTKIPEEKPINPNIINYMALGPNPVQSGESIAVYVGNLPSTNCWLAFYDERGRLVLEHAIAQSKTTNIIVLPFEAGLYQAVLRNGNEKLETEKVLVY